MKIKEGVANWDGGAMIELCRDPRVRIARQLSARIEMCWQSAWGPELEQKGWQYFKYMSRAVLGQSQGEQRLSQTRNCETWICVLR